MDAVVSNELSSRRK